MNTWHSLKGLLMIIDFKLIMGPSKAYNEASGGCEVPLRAFCCKARGGGGRLRHATEREEREEARERSNTI